MFTTQGKTMREIFKYKKGKDFYRNALEYFEYDPDNYEKDMDDPYIMDDDEISFYIAYRKGQHNSQ